MSVRSLLNKTMRTAFLKESCKPVLLHYSQDIPIMTNDTDEIISEIR